MHVFFFLISSFYSNNCNLLFYYTYLWCYCYMIMLLFQCNDIFLNFVYRFILGSFAGFLYLFDAFNGKTKTVKLRRQKANCAVCGEQPTITELGDCKELYGCSARTRVKVLISKKKTVGRFKMLQTTLIIYDSDFVENFDIFNFSSSLNRTPLFCSTKEKSSESSKDRRNSMSFLNIYPQH